MDARCYRGAEGRTKYVELRLTGRDAVAVVAAALIVTCAIALSR
jgi:energy-coupling factor transporter transmembrane protein EcfT